MTRAQFDDVHAIDLEIAKGDPGTIVTLRRLRNTIVPAGKIPDETLLQIFFMCVSEDPFLLSVHLSIAGTSSRWRNVIIAERVLWCHINCNFTGIVGELLERSLPHPILVSLTSDGMSRPNATMDAFEQVLNNAPRIQDLHIHCKDRDNTPYILERLQEIAYTVKPDFRILKVFDVSCPTSYDSVSIEHLFAQGIPLTLTELRLDTCLISWPSLLTLSLTKLYINSYERMFLIDWRSVMDHLAPFLEEFYLSTAADNYPTAGPVIDMPKLRKIVFQTHSSPFLEFLAYLRIPISAEILWESDVDEGWEQPTLPSFIPFFAAHFGRTEGMDALSFSFLYEEFSATLMGQRGGLTIKGYDSLLPSADIEEFISGLDHTLRDRIHELGFYEAGYETFPWRFMSSALPHVSRISLTKEDHTSDMMEISPLKDTPSGSRDDTHLISFWVHHEVTVFPKVTDLYLCHTSLEDVGEPENRALLDAVEKRRHAEQPIKRIHLYGRSTISTRMRHALGSDINVTLDGLELPAGGGNDEI